MRKRMVSLLLVLTMLLSMIVLPGNAATAESTNGLEGSCPCGCAQTLDQVQWKVWRGNEDTTVTSGHYYLQADYVQAAQIVVNSGNNIVIDLRGYELTTAENFRLMLIYGYVAVLDSVGGGELSAKTTGSGYGGALMLGTNETFGSTFELYGGTILPAEGSKGSRRGGLVTVGASCTFRMYGGQILNGTTFSQLADYADLADHGGCIYGDTGSNIEILGGQILGGKADGHGGAIYSMGNTVLKNCVIRGGYAGNSGGNICQNGGVLTVENAVISDGVSESSNYGGGNLSVMSSAKFTMLNSTVRNGYSKYHGGNIYLGGASGVVEQTQIESGAARVRGNNIYGATSATGLVIRDCDIPGDVGYLGKNLVLEGKVTIGLLNYGLRLYYGSDKAVANASGLSQGSEIYVIANHTFTDAGANPDYFEGAVRTVLNQTDTGLSGTQAADGELGGYCPHCMSRVSWKAFDASASLVESCLDDDTGDTDPACTGKHVQSGHYYFVGNVSSLAQQYIGVNGVAAKDVVFDINGKTITCSGRMVYTKVGADNDRSTFTLMDSYGYGSVTGSGVNNQGGGVLYNENGIINIYGGTVVYKENASRYVTNGGIIQNGGELNIYGGVLDATGYVFRDNSTSEKTYTYYGGAIYLSAGESRTLTMTAGRVEGGTAEEGGALYLSYNNQVNITGGQFAEGIALKKNSAGGGGGNLRVVGTSSNRKGALNITGACFTGGYAEVFGGNTAITNYEQIQLTDCYISDGTSGDYGGNVSALANSVPAMYTDCVILSGAAVRGANIYSGGTGNRATFVDCQVLYGKASGYAGNMNVGNGYLILKGGVIQGGIAGTYGGNISNAAGKVVAENYLKLEADDQGEPVRVYGGKAGTDGGNIYTTGNLYLTAAEIRNGKATEDGQDLYYAASTSTNKSHLLNVGQGLKGDIRMYCETGNLTDPIYAMPITDTASAEFDATIVLENVSMQPEAVAKDGKLYVSSTTVVNGEGESRWYVNNADAVASCGDTEYVKLYTDNPLVLTKDCAVDLNGHSVTVSGDYTLYGMDSATAQGENSGGSAVLDVQTRYVVDHRAPDGVRYLAVADAQTVTYHTLSMKINTVSLRPDVAGIYYGAQWHLDDTLAARVVNYGVAVSLSGMPDENLKSDSDTIYTETQGGAFGNHVEETSVLIQNIFEQDATYSYDGNVYTGVHANNLRGQTKIYATPYVILDDGTQQVCYVGDDPQLQSDDASYSLRDVLSQLDALVLEAPEQYRRYTPTLRKFYETWGQNGMAYWGFDDSYAYATPAEDDVIDVLMIGNSYCYYYVEELYAMAAAAGIKMRVCNLYYSGCPMSYHYNWWISGESKYQYFETYENGRVETKGVSLEWALAQQEWDVLSLQMGGVEMRKYTVQESLDRNRLYRTALYDYFAEQFPNADLYFHQTWAVEIGHVKDNGTWVMKDWEMQQQYTAGVREIATGICSENGVARINTGDAWELYRGACNDAQIDHNLCARLGKADDSGDPHGGDGTHDGDIGGAQFLNAAVWYEILTGKDCRENAYVPTYTYAGQTYTLGDTMLSMLRDAAHTAVNEILPTYPEYASNS